MKGFSGPRGDAVAERWLYGGSRGGYFCGRASCLTRSGAHLNFFNIKALFGYSCGSSTGKQRQLKPLDCEARPQASALLDKIFCKCV